MCKIERSSSSQAISAPNSVRSPSRVLEGLTISKPESRILSRDVDHRAHVRHLPSAAQKWLPHTEPDPTQLRTGTDGHSGAGEDDNQSAQL